MPRRRLTEDELDEDLRKFVRGVIAYSFLVIAAAALVVTASLGDLPGYEHTPANRDLLGVTFWGTLLAGLVLGLVLPPILIAAKYALYVFHLPQGPYEPEKGGHSSGHADSDTREVRSKNADQESSPD